MTKTFLYRHKLLLFIFLLFIILRLPSLFEPYWYGDEAIYLVLGQAIRKGLTLYSQIHDNKPPTLYYLAAISETVLGFRLLLALFMAGAYYYFYLLSKKFFAGKSLSLVVILFIILTSIPTIEGNIANAEVFMLLPTIAAFYYFLYSTTRFKYLISGLLLGLAFTIKIPVGVEFGMLFLWYLFLNSDTFKTKLINLSLFTLSFVLPFIIFLLYFWQKGVMQDFMFAAILQNFGYLSSWQTGSHSGGATSGGIVARAITLAIFWLFTYLLVIKKQIDRQFSVLAFWLSATIFGALLSTRPYPHYLIQVAPPLCLLLVSLFYSISFKAKSLAIGLIIVLGFYIYKYHFYFYPIVSYYQNFYSQVLTLNSSQYRNYFTQDTESLYQLSQYIEQNTTKEENIFIWGDLPSVYALSNRLPVGRFTVAYHIADFNQYQNTFDLLKAGLPRLIVYVPQAGRPFPQLDNLVGNYYSAKTVYGNAVVYLRRN